MTFVLVWPDAGQTESAVRALLADFSDDVLVAAWDPGAVDGGRAALLSSVRDAREALVDRGTDPDTLMLIGYGRAAVAAAGLARYAKRLGIGLGRVIAVAGTWNEPDPFSGSPLEEVPERVELVPENYLLATTLRRT
jgi:hypothetical protein